MPLCALYFHLGSFYFPRRRYCPTRATVAAVAIGELIHRRITSQEVTSLIIFVQRDNARWNAQSPGKILNVEDAGNSIYRRKIPGRIEILGKAWIRRDRAKSVARAILIAFLVSHNLPSRPIDEMSEIKIVLSEIPSPWRIRIFIAELKFFVTHGRFADIICYRMYRKIRDINVRVVSNFPKKKKKS